MNKRISDHLISALIGGVIGAAVVLLATGQMPTSVSVHAQTESGIVPEPPSGKFKSLEVENLVITKQATLLNAEGKEDVTIKEGSVMANNVVLGKKFIGTQYQGHVFVANRIFTSPDDLQTKPMEQWRFFTEMGSAIDAGGEVIVRSSNGPNIVGKAVTEGRMIQTGFDQNNQPQIFVRDLANGDLFDVLKSLEK